MTNSQGANMNQKLTLATPVDRVRALQEGKKIRRSHFPKGTYATLENDELLFNYKEGRSEELAEFNCRDLIECNDWELFIPPKTEAERLAEMEKILLRMKHTDLCGYSMSEYTWQELLALAKGDAQ